MPPRKSDTAQARKSDASVARVVLADDTAATSGAIEARVQLTPSATELPSMSAAPQAPSSAEKKDKDKEAGKENDSKDATTIEDLSLPKSIVTRLAKGVLPPNTQIQANAILAMSKGATVFINHLANAANEFTLASNKKTVMPNDVFKALDELEFGFMRERVEAEFAKFNEVQTSKRSTYRKKVAAAKKAATGGDSSILSMDASGMHGDISGTMGDSTLPGAAGEQQPRSKKARTDGEADSSKMDVDEEDGADEGGEPSDAETVPDDPVEEDEDEEDDNVEEDEDEEDEEDDEEEEERDELEEPEVGLDHDEALDDGDDSD